MNTVIIDKKDLSISINNKTLHIEDKKIPLRLIDTLIINSSIKLLASDIIKMTKENIIILFISSNGTDSAIVNSTKTKSAHLKANQYKAHLKDSLLIAKYLLKEKIKTHINHLLSHEIRIDINDLLEKIDKSNNLKELLGVEGSFSKLYFKYYFNLLPKSMHKGKRSKRPPLDPANALLSFFYSLFYNFLTIRLLSFGFEPSIGFLHTPFRSHNALSSDILEIFRADINEFVLNILKNRKVLKDDFTKRGGVYLRYSGRKKLWKDYKNFTSSLSSRVDFEISNIRAMICKEEF